MVRGVSNRMESTMYEDNNFNHRINNDVNRLKRNLTLDLDCNNLNAKRPKYNSPMMLGVPVLSSPDVSKLKLTSPEIEKFILAQQNGLLFTPTPSTPHSKILFPKSITDQESCDLPDDLTEFTTTDSSQGSLQVEMPRSSSGSNSSSGNLLLDNNYVSMHTEYSSINHLDGIKDEHQIVPSLDSSPPLSPINMESQEIIKLERKRMRNRVAASKCRRRKLERIAKLEDRVKVLKGENTELNSIIIKLKEEVCKLKQNVLEHVQGGCQIIVSNFCAKNHDG